MDVDDQTKKEDVDTGAVKSGPLSGPIRAAAERTVIVAKAAHAWTLSRLVDDWRQAWRWISTWAFGIFFTLPIAWMNSPDLQKAIPPKWLGIISPVVAAIGFTGRLYKQGKKEIQKPSDPDSN